MESTAQILGIIACGIAFAVYQMKSRKALIIAQSILIFILAVHYLLLGAYAAMAMNFLSILRNIIYYRKDIFKSKYWPIINTAVIFIAGVLTSSGLASVLVIIGITITSYCMSFENPQHYRISILFSAPFVLIYNILVWSIGGIVLESTTIISSAIGVYRFSKKPNE